MKLPVVSGSETVKAFLKVGFEFDIQHGSHIILRRADPPHRRLSVPNHKELISKGNFTNSHSGSWVDSGRVRFARVTGQVTSGLTGRV